MGNISPYLLLVISIFAALVCSTSNKIFSNKQPSVALKSLGVSIFSLVSCLTLYIWDGFGNISTFSLVFGILFGVVTFLANIMLLSAFSLGPWSYTYVMICLSMLMPAFSGALFWGDKIGILQYVGTLLMIVCIILSVDKKADDKKANIKWLLCTVAAFLMSGSIGIMQKVHQTSQYKNELNGFLIVSFFAGAVLSLVSALISKIKEKQGTEKKEGIKSWKEIVALAVIFVLIGVSTAANHKLNLYLSGVLPSAVFFPAVNGGPLVLASLTAFIFFKERLSKKQWIGLLIGTAAVFLLTI